MSALSKAKLTVPVLVDGGPDVTNGVAADRSTFHTTDLGPLSLPARSTALTAKVCKPSVRLESERGLVQVAKAAPSSEHL